MRGERFQLRGLYLPGFPLLQQFFFQLQGLLRWSCAAPVWVRCGLTALCRHAPKLADHFQEQGIVPDMYATQWFMTAYAHNFPIEVRLPRRRFSCALSEKHRADCGADLGHLPAGGRQDW